MITTEMRGIYEIAYCQNRPACKKYALEMAARFAGDEADRLTIIAGDDRPKAADLVVARNVAQNQPDWRDDPLFILQFGDERDAEAEKALRRKMARVDGDESPWSMLDVDFD
jgi:hypothetical protein